MQVQELKVGQVFIFRDIEFMRIDLTEAIPPDDEILLVKIMNWLPLAICLSGEHKGKVFQFPREQEVGSIQENKNTEKSIL